MSDFVRITSTTAAKIFNLFPRKGIIAPGSDADLILFDPEIEHTLSASTHHSRIDSSVYEGRKVKGKVTVTISRGKVVWENGRLHTTPGEGRFIAMPPIHRCPLTGTGLKNELSKGPMGCDIEEKQSNPAAVQEKKAVEVEDFDFKVEL